MLVQLLAGSAAMLVPALEATRVRPVLMSEGGESVAKTKGPIIEPETLEAVKAAVSEVEVLADEEAAPKRFNEQRFDEQHYLTLYNPTQAVQTDSVRVQYQPTLSLFEFLLTERAATASAEEEKSPLDAQVEEKVAGLRLLQAELGVVVSHGLMSEQRQQWLEAKAALEEKKRECTQKWASLQSSHADAADAWKQLAEQAGEEPERSGEGRKARSALVASKKLGVPQIFAKTFASVVKVPAFAVPDLCASPGRAWWLPAARRSQEKRSSPVGTQPLPRVLELRSPKTPISLALTIQVPEGADRADQRAGGPVRGAKSAGHGGRGADGRRAEALPGRAGGARAARADHPAAAGDPDRAAGACRGQGRLRWPRGLRCGRICRGPCLLMT